jgi:hypothetical protein
MAGVYHHGEWVEIDGKTIISTKEIEKEMEKPSNEWEYTRALQWVLDNATHNFGGDDENK